ncbi:MAG: YbjQ family protein [Anaerolineales bacterium]|nr:YbjQ family protein [Anaerolineales bacterium]MCB8936798.1 YbjQ family protein [Ardenticatenaceae bacterium]
MDSSYSSEIQALIEQLKAPAPFHRITALEKLLKIDPPPDNLHSIAQQMKDDSDANVRHLVEQLVLKLGKEGGKFSEEENLILTTTHFIEGRTITKYIEVITAEVVLGTGVFSEIGANIADIFGKRAAGFQEKLQEARKLALDELRILAFKKNADAIVGLDLDFMNLGNNVLVVIATGTGVKLSNNDIQNSDSTTPDQDG